MTRVLALDVGSSSARAAVFEADASPVEGATAQVVYSTPGERDAQAELDPEQLVAASEAAVERALAAGARVDAVAVSCFWHSLLPLDGSGRPLAPLLTWRDTRAAGHAEELRRRLDADAVWRRTGAPLHPSFWPAKLAWLAATQPDVFARTARFVSFGEYLAARLGGGTATSVSMASGTGLLDQNRLCWDAELLAELRLDVARLPEISDERAGERTPWFPAAGDGACSNLGAGCTMRERAALMVGTSGAVRVLWPAKRAEPARGLFLYRLDQRRFVEGGSLSDGGNLYAWLAQTLRTTGARGLADRPPDGHGLTFLALLGGERSPGWNALARGAVTGLTFATTPDDLLQAALEGVAYRFAEILDLMPGVKEVVATGHALLVDPDWVQILADVLERPVVASAVEEGSIRGAAVLALERLGETPAPAALGRVFDPRQERADPYRLARWRQRDLYEAVTR